MKNNPELVRGGQGHDDEEITLAAFCNLAAIILALALVASVILF